ncbi:enolase-phosphatase E1-like [Colletes gigas]|uniref:enolase-phosphatase E1-like n=1 Tax=Colletes gigas TaxID=935657 RepID=UPI001C9AC1CB|nr:enolase-phosphatase E1-like [Colletes gigas]
MAGEKRTKDQEETLLSETTILVDIEGTTTSISFVKDTLFPYVRENLKKYIETKWEDEEFKQDFEKLKEQAKKDEVEKVDGFVPVTGSNTEEEKESLMKNILWQMDCDRKTGALKQLQGHMWREAYNSGSVKAHVYEDVPKALESWTNDGRKVYVYSSGSVEAQKLLFGHSVHGDLLKYFSGYFDTEVGAKQESSSYKTISNKIGAEPSSIIFLTDTVKEAAAAKEAGLSTVILLREGNIALSDEERVPFTTIKSFLDLTFQTSTKRQKLETTETPETVTKSAPDVCEPMDTSEDVEMADVSEKKDEKVDAKEAVQTETKECGKDQLPKETQKSDTKTEEPMITDAKDTTNTEKVVEKVATDKVEAQPSEVSIKTDISENVPAVSNNTESTSTTSKNDVDKSVDSEKVEKPVEVAEKVVKPAPVEATVTVNDPVDVVASEPKTKSGEVSITESKTDEPTNITKETKPEDSKVSDVKSNENVPEEKKSSSSVEEKTEECTSKTEKETKEESTDKTTTNPSTTETQKPENDGSSVKPAQESTKTEEKPIENGDVSLTNAEKVTAPTITEPEATSSKVETHAEVKNVTETVTETKPEVESESVNEKSPKAKETEEAAAVPVNDAEKKEVSTEVSKQESTEKSVKEETVVDEVKETNTVDSEKKKLNGTTQNGDTDAPVSDDKLHRNGLNEGSSNENVNSSTSESTSAQNGEPESSSEANAESIKVKKVVDSTVADGAGEPDVVPPVVVAATS